MCYIKKQGVVTAMKKGDVRRQEILDRLADHVLLHGVQGASLRPLAAAAGTSDRMLLHYFADKEALLTAVLQVVTNRLIVILESARIEPLPFQTLLPALAGMLSDPRIRPYARVWLDVVTLAAGEGGQPFRAIGQTICDTFLDWIAAVLAVEQPETRAPLAALTLAIIEGLIIFDSLGDASKRTAALAGVALITADGRTTA
jgi:AcrR family transcriptional regulator